MITCRLNMKLTYEDYSRLPYWSHTDLAYINHDPELKDFYLYEPSSQVIPQVIQERKKFKTDRNLLLSVIKRQYAGMAIELPFDDKVLLDENTFTVTTAHQPSLFTGPLFHIYKIASTIHLAKKLNKDYPQYTFLPVFIMSGEDHDWAEINHFFLFGRKYQWNREASGPCGRLSDEGLNEMIEVVLDVLKNAPFFADIKELLRKGLVGFKNYGQFHSILVATLFKDHNLIVLNPDDHELKKAFIPVIEKEITQQFSYQPVTSAQTALEEKGFKPQAFCRHVNLFYMTDDKRERLDPVEGGFVRVESGIEYTTEEILNELYAFPERFSPNVILRPLFQEYILPNIAYIGGGGELAYWLERKTQFEKAGIPYPMLIRRNSLLILDPLTRSQMQKLGLVWMDLAPDLDAIYKTYLMSHSETDLNFERELNEIRTAYQSLADKAEKLDPTLAKAIIAEEYKHVKQFEQLGSRLLRTEKQHQETQLKKIQRLKEKLFPESGLQERHENFLSFYSVYGQQWIDELIKICDPFNEKFILAEPQEADLEQALVYSPKA